MTIITCPSCGAKVPSTKAVCPHCGCNLRQSANGGALLALALVLAIIFAPIIIVLGLFGKFLLKGLYKNVVEIEEFKKFRKIYTIVCLSWFFLSIAFCVLCGVLQLPIIELAFYALCGGNIALFVLSIVFGNKIYKKHKDEIPADSTPAEATDPDEEPMEAEGTETESAIEESSNDDAGESGSREYGNKKKIFELLAELAALRDANVLTEEEFNEQKQQILRAHYESAPKPTAAEKTNGKKPVAKVEAAAVSNKKPVASKETKQSPAKKKPWIAVIIASAAVLVVGAIVAVIILATGHKHTFTIETVAPTCDEDGYTRHTCHCGEVYTDAIVSATGHSLENGSCTKCAYTELQYELSQTGDSYVFQGGFRTDNVVIPSEYNGLPVTGIGAAAFYGCSDLTSITIPDSVTDIGNSAFCLCSGLTSVTIPDSVTNIGDDAFYGCTGLTSITIPDSVTNIGVGAFSGCTGLTDVTVLANEILVASNAFSLCPIERATIPASISREIPNYVLKEILFTAGEIPNEAFRGAHYLTTVTISGTTTSIGVRAFMDCDNLTNVILEKDSRLTSIEDGAFTQCYALTSITIPASITNLGASAFYNCTGLERVDIYDLAAWCNIDFQNTEANPLYYANHLYLNGEEITKLVIPASVSTISDYAFHGCDGLTDITIPDSITKIGYYVFADCRGLTNITLADSVTEIGRVAFVGCESLKTITIPASVKNIDYYAFARCTNLERVIILDGVENISTAAFAYCDKLTIYCEAASKPSGWEAGWNSGCPVVWGYEKQ